MYEVDKMPVFLFVVLQALPVVGSEILDFLNNLEAEGCYCGYDYG